jgi:lysosomal-associated membrane protein 1/2
LKLFHVGNEFITPLKRSYYCTKVQTLNLTNSETSNATVAIVELSQLHFEAFHKQDNDKYSEVKDCESAGTPDIVPIAVGCALAALVVIVLIAYLVGRRNAHARGYLSM